MDRQRELSNLTDVEPVRVAVGVLHQVPKEARSWEGMDGDEGGRKLRTISINYIRTRLHGETFNPRAVLASPISP